MNKKVETEVKRINGYLKEVVTFFDSSGKPISHVINPLMVELKPRDISQLFIGALLVSTPLCFTEEVWTISENLKMTNIYYLILCSFITITGFVYFNFYRFKLKGNIIEFIKRILAIYLITTLSAILVLFLIDKFPIMENAEVAMKRVIIISFPSLFGATVTDYLK